MMHSFALAAVSNLIVAAAIIIGAAIIVQLGPIIAELIP
jgi:hypothetical protein